MSVFPRIGGLLAVLILLGGPGASNVTAQEPRELSTLWSIGQSDNNTADLALGPKDYSAYREPAFFVVGRSDAKADWPYVQPGVVDGGWAPGGPQAFTVVFALEKPPAGPCQLILDLTDTHSKEPPRLRVEVNDLVKEYEMPLGGGDASVFGDPAKGKEHVITIDLPAETLRAGENTIRITTLSGSWILWDALRLEAQAGTALAEVASQTFLTAADQRDLLRRDGEKLVQPVALAIRHLGEPVQAVLRIEGIEPIDVALKTGVQKIEAWIPSVEELRTVRATLTAGETALAEADLALRPVRRWEIHLIHQTHLDIGYTHRQQDVLKRQVDFLYQALDFIKQTADYPEDARFRWHPEGMWAIDEFLRTAPEEKRREFLDAVRGGYIHLDAFYVHMMTGLGTDEELIELLAPAKDFQRQYGVEVVSAIGSDVPGYTWGLVSAMGQQGVKYLNTAPNNNHRLGYIYLLANRPFYWEDQAGEHRVLCWMVPTSYIYFWIAGSQDVGSAVLQYIDKYLESEDYPYDIAQIRYEVGGDNGHPDLNLAKQVKAWNEQYAWPRIIISTNTRLFTEFERRYGEKLPVLPGDMTPYWEDGAASTAADLAVNRRAKERLAQAERLGTILDPGTDRRGLFAQGWYNAVMYDEHTWGAHCSISEPFSPFTVSQEQFKQNFAVSTGRVAEEIFKQVTEPITLAGSKTIDLYNTSRGDRGGVVLLSPELSAGGDGLIDAAGNRVPTQRLASGELAVLAPAVPAFSAGRFTLQEGPADANGDVKVTENVLENGRIRIEIDPKNGSIHSIVSKTLGKELVDRSQGFGVNDYLYTLGRTTGEGYQRIESAVTISIEDAGPVVGTLRIECDAPGCEKLVRRVRIFADCDRVDLINRVDKRRELQPESVYFAFPFQVPGGQPRIDVPFSVVRPEKDQLPGANRNYYCVQRWVDVSNDEYGVTWITRDAPMLQFHPFKIIGRGRGCVPDAGMMYDKTPDHVYDFWDRSITPGGFFYSWVMNNHWETNYKAYQEGPHEYVYTLLPHGQYDQAAAQRTARDVMQPLLPLPVDPCRPIPSAPVRVEGDGVVVTSLRASRDGSALMIRLFVGSGKPERVTLDWARPRAMYRSDPQETRGETIAGPIELPAYGVVTIRAEQQ